MRVLDRGSVTLIDHMGSDLTVCNAARVSFNSESEWCQDQEALTRLAETGSKFHKEDVQCLCPKDKKLIKYLIKHRHTSTLEHCVVTFRFKVPLFIRSQHHRHRTWSYNEISRRYTDFNLEVYQPKKFRKQSASNRQASTDDTFSSFSSMYTSAGVLIFSNGFVFM